MSKRYFTKDERKILKKAAKLIATVPTITAIEAREIADCAGTLLDWMNVEDNEDEE